MKLLFPIILNIYFEVNNSTHEAENLELAIAVCATLKIKPLSKESVLFSLVWNMPHISFPQNKEKVHKRFYTKYFPSDDKKSTEDIACYATANHQTWLKAIEDWRLPIISKK